MRIPRVSGRSDSALKYLMVCGLPSSKMSKSLLFRLGISAPCLSLTLKKSWTTSTLTLRVSTDSPCCAWPLLGWSLSLWCSPGVEEFDVGAFEAEAGGCWATAVRHAIRVRTSRLAQGLRQKQVRRIGFYSGTLLVYPVTGC